MPKFFSTTVEFQSVEPYFSAERDGRKPNTLRCVTDDEYAIIKGCSGISVVGPDGEWFHREIVSVFDVECVVAPIDLPGRLVLISWKHEVHHARV